MKITFVSNYLNHHQIPFCLAMNELCQGSFRFVSMEPMEEERLQLGWAFDTVYDFEVKAWQDEAKMKLAKQLIDDSDVVLFGGNSYAKHIRERILKNKLTFLYSERVFKKGVFRAVSPRGQYYMRRDNTRYQNNNLYLLSASAYAPYDFSLVGAYKNKAFKWGYFPKTYTYDINTLLQTKNNRKIQILWAARFISWKHPNTTIKLAKMLKKNGYEFEMNLIGVGPLENKIRESIKKNDLTDCVSMLGSMSPQEVRSNMEKANIFLITSDYNEGWGAVLNEAMNSACAVVTSHAIGAAPYLIKHKTNGLIFKSGNVKDLYNQVKSLIENPQLRENVSVNAYKTITETWNAENAAKNLFEISSCLLSKNKPFISNGPCSSAKIIPQNKMYKKIMSDTI